MRVVLTGATGFVGGEVLAQLLADPSIDGVTCLVRRPVEVTSTKLHVIVHENFAIYDAVLAKNLAAHDACIWALGGKATDSPDSDAYLRATHTFTLAFAQAVAAQADHAFRFCYLSGMGADPDETSWFPWQKQTRHLKGRTERDLHRLQEGQPLFSVTCFRPAGILPKTTGGLVMSLLAPIAVRVDQLAKAMVQSAGDVGFAGYAVVSNGMIKGMV